MSLHVALGLLSWADLLEDGNLLWEIALTEVRARSACDCCLPSSC